MRRLWKKRRPLKLSRERKTGDSGEEHPLKDFINREGKEDEEPTRKDAVRERKIVDRANVRQGKKKAAPWKKKNLGEIQKRQRRREEENIRSACPKEGIARGKKKGEGKGRKRGGTRRGTSQKKIERGRRTRP